MNVRELIDKLQSFDLEAVVFISGEDDYDYDFEVNDVVLADGKILGQDLQVRAERGVRII